MERVVVVDCPRCEAKVNASVARVEATSGVEGDAPYRISLSRCPGCSEPLVTREECLGPGEWGDTDDVYAPAVRVWPEPDRKAHTAIPAIVQVSLDEAHKCRRAGAYTACAVMCGRAVEGVCVHFEIKSMLAKGLNELRAKGLIDERLFRWGEELRRSRNAAAHATGDKISREDATDLLDFVSAICEYIFVLTARFEAFMARKMPVKAASDSTHADGVPTDDA